MRPFSGRRGTCVSQLFKLREATSMWDPTGGSHQTHSALSEDMDRQQAQDTNLAVAEEGTEEVARKVVRWSLMGVILSGMVWTLLPALGPLGAVADRVEETALREEDAVAGAFVLL